LRRAFSLLSLLPNSLEFSCSFNSVALEMPIHKRGKTPMGDYPMEPVPGLQSGAGPAGSDTTIVLTQLAQQYLDQTRPWVRFMSILVFVGAAMMAVAGLVMMALIMVGGLGVARGTSPFGAIGGVVVGVFYLALACLYIAPGVYLHRYAGAINQLKATRAAGTLEDALRHQRSFWRFVGIMSIIGIAIGMIAMVLVVVLGVIGAMMAGRS
jgi:hypothetical protein